MCCSLQFVLSIAQSWLRITGELNSKEYLLNLDYSLSAWILTKQLINIPLSRLCEASFNLELVIRDRNHFPTIYIGIYSFFNGLFYNLKKNHISTLSLDVIWCKNRTYRAILMSVFPIGCMMVLLVGTSYVMPYCEFLLLQRFSGLLRLCFQYSIWFVLAR